MITDLVLLCIAIFVFIFGGFFLIIERRSIVGGAMFVMGWVYLIKAAFEIFGSHP